MDELEPLPVDRLAASLTADSDDLDLFARVLSNKLLTALPEAMVEADFKKTRGSRLGKKTPELRRLLVRFPEREFELANAGTGSMSCQVRTVVRGVTISRSEVTMPEWIGTLSRSLAAYAEHQASARAALLQLLEG
ncbi:MAG: hypothetical protein ACP5PJ_08400 [Acidimicrobiales bacterium]